VSLHTALLESIAERYRRDNEINAAEHLEALDIFEGLQERTLEANGSAARLGYDVKKLPRGQSYRIRFDRRNRSIELCLDLATYEALDRDEVHARAVAVGMIADLMLRFRRLTAETTRSNWRAIDCPCIPEANELADAMLLPASGIEQWKRIQPTINSAELAAIFKVKPATAERRVRLFGKHRNALLAAADGALSVDQDVRLRIQSPGVMKRAINFLLHGD
jgi:hypothetical protein